MNKILKILAVITLLILAVIGYLTIQILWDILQDRTPVVGGYHNLSSRECEFSRINPRGLWDNCLPEPSNPFVF